MRWRERQQGNRHRAGGDPIWTPVLTIAVTILLTTCLGAMAILQFEQFGPQVGAIVVFKPGTQSMDHWRVRASAGDSGGLDRPSDVIARACDLSPGAMATGGGSLVVEARRMSRPPVYRVRWVGTRTSDGDGDCGKEASFVLSRTELQKLANTAGGFGVGRRLIGP
jgi:hypothetical protein